MTLTDHPHKEANMTITDTRTTVTTTVAAPPTTYRLRNPWRAHLLAACATGAVTTAGAVGAAVTGSARLDLSALAVLVAVALVVALHVAYDRYEQRPPHNAVFTQNTA